MEVRDHQFARGDDRAGRHIVPVLRGQRLAYLFAHAAALAPQPLRLAFLLGVAGYGTKVGLAPMHTWLPDVHAEAPSPASAMLSAALLNTGMYAIIRFLAITQVRLGATFPRAVLLTFGFASVLVGVLFMVRRGNFKRLFAYSSVEHMGIIAVALGFESFLPARGRDRALQLPGVPPARCTAHRPISFLRSAR